MRKAQSILEYIIVLTAIIVAVMAAADEFVKPAVQDMYRDATDVIRDKSTDFLLNAAGGSDSSRPQD